MTDGSEVGRIGLAQRVILRSSDEPIARSPDHEMPRSPDRRRGFTLIEMVIVISLILVLLAIALPMYQRSIQRAKEANLHYNVMVLNKVIQEYIQDKKKAPLTPDDLVQAGYLKAIPDDITGRSDTWVWEQEAFERATDPNQPGIASAHSGSNEISSEGTPYSSWVK